MSENAQMVLLQTVIPPTLPDSALAGSTTLVWQAAIAGFVTLAMAWMSQRAKASADKAAVKTEEVKTSLQETTKATDAKLEKIENTANATHVLVNSNMGAQLKISAIALRRLAVNTKDPGDEAAAIVAEKALAEHQGKQDKVDTTIAIELKGTK